MASTKTSTEDWSRAGFALPVIVTQLQKVNQIKHGEIRQTIFALLMDVVYIGIQPMSEERERIKRQLILHYYLFGNDEAIFLLRHL